MPYSVSILWRTLTLLACLMVMVQPPATLAQPAAPAVAQSSGLPQAIPAARYAEKLVVITIDRVIDAHTHASVERRMAAAVEAGATGIVFEINTPGGELGAVLALCNRIKTCPVKNTIAWVHPEAYSGGCLIALACREIIVSESAVMGDALVIGLSSKGLMVLPDAERQKLTAPLLAELIDSARLNGYDESLVQGFVSLGVELWMLQNVDDPNSVIFVNKTEYKRIFGTNPPEGAKASNTGVSRPAGAPAKAPDLDPGQRPDKSAIPPRDPDASPFVPASPDMDKRLIERVDASMKSKSTRPTLTAADASKWKLVEYAADGLGPLTLKKDKLFTYRLAQRAATGSGTVNNDDELKAFTGAKTFSRLDMNWAEHTAVFLSQQVPQIVLIALLLLCGFVEMTHPGLVVPGIIGFICLFLLLGPMILAGMANWWAIAAILLGILLITMEIFVLPGFGVPGVLGLVLLFGGLVGVFIPTGAAAVFGEEAGSTRLLTAVATVSIATITAIVGMYFLAKHLPGLPVLNRLVLQNNPGGDTDGEGAVATSGAEADAIAAAVVAIGESGVAMTALRPSGTARFGDRVVDVLADGGFVSPGEAVRVVRIDGMGVTVERA